MIRTMIMMTIVAHVNFICPGQAIRFENANGWEQVKEKARNEQKFIFVDCYTTWCGPCKKMDEKVYVDSSVANFVNEWFISIKVQMDSSGLDTEHEKQWYRQASEMMHRYNVHSFPTFLFFSPQAELVHKGIGYKESDEFIAVATAALDSTKQYFTALRKYQQGEIDFRSIHNLALASDAFGDKELAKELAKFYKEGYLDKLSGAELCRKFHIDFITKFYFLVTSKDNFFKLFHDNPQVVDSLTYSGFSKKWVRYIIRKEEFEDKLWRHGKAITKRPNWHRLYSSVALKYGHLHADSLVDDVKLDFYKRTKNWREFARLRDAKIKSTPPRKGMGLLDPDGTWLLNSDAWDIFVHCTEPRILSRALSWVDLAIQLEGRDESIQALDTKANLLYKLGRVDEAISIEEEAIALSYNYARKHNLAQAPNVEEYRQVLDKMKQGIPTWEDAK